ncbi:zinc ribbon domain-containing protein [Lactobacillus kimbladii]|uniref:zinc ribbon domain-containing protein n=1 Tax=Lactobacillus kimbladii TaxID=1218506 RepID=UPI003AF8C6E7
MNDKKFCPNCGKEVKPNAEFCPNCGQKLPQTLHSRKEYRSQQRNTAAQPVVNQPQATASSVHQHQPMKKRNKVLLICLGVLIVAFAAFYAWGSNHYQRNNQINQIAASLKNPHSDLAQFVVSENPNARVTTAALKPTQEYYAEHYVEADKMADAFKYGNEYENVCLVQSGRYLLLFPKYCLQLKTYTPQIRTNHANSTIYVNNKKFGGVDGSGEDYYKKIAPLFPGKYHIEVKSIASGHQLSADKSTTIFSNKEINMNIKTVNFMIKSIPSATIYINDKKVGNLDKRGTKVFKDYPVTDDMKIYVVTKVDGKSIKSESVDYDDMGFEDDDDSSSNVIKPEWPGLISKDDAEELLENDFTSPDEDDFVGGAENKGYQELHSQDSGFDNDDDINDYNMECSVVSITPAPNNCSSVTYKITYTFEHDDFEHKQVMLYTGGLFKQTGDNDDNNQKIKSIGNGKIISDKKYDN